MTGLPAEKMDPYFGFDVAVLMDMLTYRRPHASKTEEQFIEKFIDPLAKLDHVYAYEQDGFGNRWAFIAGEGEDIMWSCHTDTVHYKDGKQAVSKRKDIVTLNKRSKSNCLGADDTAGVWLMVNMIQQGKPGTYVFHRGEECGGLGSDYVATHEKGRLKNIQAAIALDRKGYDNIITHQGARCCSDEFAESLADALPTLAMEKDDTGLFTDTANYTHLVPECTNLSVGYGRQHTAKEWQDVAFLCQVLDALLALDVSKLVIKRDPVNDHDDAWDWLKDDEGEDEYNVNGYDYKWHEDPNHPDYKSTTTQPNRPGNYYDMELDAMIRFCEDEALVVAKMLMDDGYTIDEVYQAKESYRQAREKFKDIEF
jgi:hypothetical protein